LEQRLIVTRIRECLGLPAGQALTKLEGDGPDVSWMCEYASREDYVRDRAIREASAEFRAARNAMHTLLTRFERHVAIYASHRSEQIAWSDKASDM
jgi:hypothetical protein